MFNFLCVNCGATEMLHMRPVILYSCLNMATWPDWEYFDCVSDVPEGLSSREAVRFLRKHNTAYQHSLKNCPGFQYKKEDCTLVVESFVRHPQWDDFLPIEWRGLFEHSCMLIEEEKDKRVELFHLPSTTYVVFDPRNGHSYVAHGE